MSVGQEQFLFAVIVHHSAWPTTLWNRGWQGWSHIISPDDVALGLVQLAFLFKSVHFLNLCLGFLLRTVLDQVLLLFWRWLLCMTWAGEGLLIEQTVPKPRRGVRPSSALAVPLGPGMDSSRG